jgi:hypothetical protein
MAAELFTCPADLTLVGDSELADLSTQAHAEFERVHGLGDYSPETIAYATSLTDSLDRLRVETGAREERARLAEAQSQDSAAREMARLAERVNGPADPVPAAPVFDADALATAMGTALAAALSTQGATPAETVRRAASLAASRQHQPPPEVQPRAVLQVTSSRDLPARQLSAGSNVPSVEALADTFIDAARSLPVTTLGNRAPRYQVARVQNEFTHTVDDRTPVAQVERLINELTSRDRQEALLAGGGWCAPSEIKYDFFNIAEAPTHTVDLPTMGISRGGIQFPVSPAIGDVFYTSGASNAASGMGGFAFAFSNGTDPWLWSETDDILTVTGSINKPTLRVPCPTFSTVRLEAYGLTLTAGNLTDNAYPEATQNFLRLLRAAYGHAINARILSLMTAASSGAVSSGGFGMTNGAVTQFPGAVALAATDYRARYGMDVNAVLEVVMPYWVMDAIRSDFAWKQGVDMTAVSDAMIQALFTVRNVHIQWVDDYQVRGAGQPGVAAGLTNWPTTATFMMYAAGTFIHGTGLTLDLGVVRDSVLNAENDFTAAWAEEAHLVAKVGHESRQYTVAFKNSVDLPTAVSAQYSL